MAIGFDVPEGDPYKPVKYRRTRPPEPAGRTLSAIDLDDLLRTKFSAWRYETEYRCFCRLAQSIEENGLFFEPFSEDLKAGEVIIGSKSAITRTQLATALGDNQAHVTSFKARPAFGTFSVVRNRNSALWT